MLELAVAGATGRMGRTILEMAARDERFQIVAALTDSGDPLSGKTIQVGAEEITIVEKLGIPCEVLIDFTTAEGTMAWLDVCERFEIPMVIGATGHDELQINKIRESSRLIPMVKAVNFSPAMHAMAALVGRLAAELTEGFDIELIEAHHRHKVDAPSGTMLMLLDDILRNTGRTREKDVVFGREGLVGEKPAGQIGVHSIRSGELAGRHEVHFGGQGETLTITHTVQSRDTFAAGALRAAAWVVEQEPGLYSLGDLLGQPAVRDSTDDPSRGV